MVSFGENESCPVRLHNGEHCYSEFSAHLTDMKLQTDFMGQ